MIYLILPLNRNKLNNKYEHEHNYNNKVKNYTLDNVTAWYKKWSICTLK